MEVRGAHYPLTGWDVSHHPFLGWLAMTTKSVPPVDWSKSSYPTLGSYGPRTDWVQENAKTSISKRLVKVQVELGP